MAWIVLTLYLEVAGVAHDKNDAVAWLSRSSEISRNQNEDEQPWYLGENRYHEHQIQQIMGAAGNFFESGNLPLAETMYRQALELSPSNSRILYMLGKVLNAMDSLEQAHEMMHQALLYSSQNALIHAELGDIYRKMNKPQAGAPEVVVAQRRAAGAHRVRDHQHTKSAP